MLSNVNFYFRLAGKLQYLLCNVLQASAEVYTRSQSINEIKNNRLHCHSSCSAKELQQCLVITGTVELLKTITHRLEVTLFSRKNSLHPTFFVWNGLPQKRWKICLQCAVYQCSECYLKSDYKKIKSINVQLYYSRNKLITIKQSIILLIYKYVE